MNPLECKACFEEYHATTRRPRALQCGHSYCESCLGVLLKNQKIRCPTCRKEHNVTDVNELMVVYDLIELLDGQQAHKLVSLKPGECDEHGCPLNFYCAKHQVWICRDCTVMDHPKETCSIKSKKVFLKEKVAEEKKKLLAETDAQDKCQSYLRKYCDEIKKGIDNHQIFVTKMQSTSQIHLDKKKCLETELQSVESVINEIGLKNTVLISMIPNISEMEEFKDLQVALKKSEELCCNVQNWREMQNNKYTEKSDTSSAEIMSSCDELINLTLTDTQRTIVHKGYNCDECDARNIKGDRYCCLVCMMYDICGACERTGVHRHHVKMKIPNLANIIQIDSSRGILDSSGSTDNTCGPANVLNLKGRFWNPQDLPRHYNNWYIVFDLKSSFTVTEIHLQNYGDTTHDIKEFKLESSTDKINWSSVGTKFVAKTGTNKGQDFGYFYATGRYWKFTGLSTPQGWQPWLLLLQLFGFQN